MIYFRKNILAASPKFLIFCLYVKCWILRLACHISFWYHDDYLQSAEFNLGSGGIDYQVSVTGVSNVTSVSINSGNVGENGPVIVTLFEPNATADLSNDIQAEGTITSADLEGPMQGKEISDLVSALGSGVTYVNVLTQANPDGEIRGQN